VGEVRNAYNILVEKPAGKTTLRNSRRTREENIKTDPTEMEC
jgi:hypothetical protein